MPLAEIIQTKPEAPTPVITKQNVIAAKTYSSNVVDTKYTPLSSLVAFVEGSSWTINYYSQVVDTSNELKGQDAGQSGVYQQYTLIQDLQVKVANPISWSQEQERKLFKVTGAAYVHSYVIPSEGDMFAADVGDGREGIFQVTLSEKKSLLKDSASYIEYIFVYYADQDPSRRKDLDTKTIKKVVYVRDFLLYGQNPLLIESDFEAIQQLNCLYSEIIHNYLDWFFSNEFKTLLIPGQDSFMYDHFVTDMLLKITDTRDDQNLRYIRRYNVDDDYALKQPQIWKALLNKDKSALRLGNAQMGLLNVSAFNRNPMLESICYSCLKYIVYPANPATNVDKYANSLSFGREVGWIELQTASSPGGFTNDIVGGMVGDSNSLTINQVTMPLIKNVLVDGFYVLSQNFYEDTAGQSVLEFLTRNYMNNKAIDPKVLLAVAKSYTNWGGLERFYYLPIILVLIKACARFI